MKKMKPNQKKYLIEDHSKSVALRDTPGLLNGSTSTLPVKRMSTVKLKSATVYKSLKVRR